ncbi:MAG: dihydroxy-acid dehydratase, partial [Elusimicrobia bacterium]|nr:dihydroxy-acid dehydratase [Elusimicrobiota bacterium]
MKKKKPAQSETPPAVEKPEINASLIGILGWNSPRFAASHESFLDSLKKAIAIQGGSPLFFGLTGGYEPLDLLHYADGKDRVSTGSRTDANHYPLPARDMVADQVELITQEENLKGLVMIPWSVPSLVGQLMAAIRCGIPTIFLPHYLTWQAEELAGESGKKEADSVPYSQCSLLLSLEVLGLTKIGSLEKIFSVEPAPLAGNAQALEFAEWGGQSTVEFV